MMDRTAYARRVIWTAGLALVVSVGGCQRASSPEDDEPTRDTTATDTTAVDSAEPADSAIEKSDGFDGDGSAKSKDVDDGDSAMSDGGDIAPEDGVDADDTSDGTGESFERIVLQEGESKTVRLEDGDVFENKLVDARARGASFRIRASGSGWTVRDVGIVGPLPSSVSHVMRIRVDDPEGVGIIENIYVEDVYNNFMFVHAYHEGHIEIRNSTFIDNLRDQEDILYGSPPGNPDADWGKQTGRGGTIHIDGCFGKDIGGYGWRLGSDGSKVENTVLVGQNVALANLWGEDVEFRNVDVVDANIGLRLNSHIHGDKNLETTRTIVQNVQIDAETPVQRNEHQGKPPELVGSVGSNPDPTPPPGAPMNAREAASGR